MAQVKTNLGKVSICPKGVWTKDTIYDRLDAVSHDGSSYLSLVNNNTAEPSNTTNWLMLAQRADASVAIAGAEAATEKANTAAEKADTATNNADAATTSANTAATRLNTLCDNRDKVVDGYWWHYNEATKEYENTGEIAKGNVMYATFSVTDEARLVMTTDEEYTGANFALDENGILTVTL